ncbi:MAG: ArnT family glycosyltransferase [Bacteroidales bacterium]
MKKNILSFISGNPSNFYRKLFLPSNLYIVLAIYTLAYIATMYHRFIQIDENWFGEQAYWLVNEGVVKLKSMPGILDFDKHMYMYHKFLVWIAALIIQVGGWSVYYFKFATLVVYLLFFYAFYRFYKSNKAFYTYQHFLLASVLLVLIPIMLQQSFIFRPEVYVMTFGFISYFFLDKYLKNNKIQSLIAASVFAGVAFLITLNAMIFPIAGFFLLLFKKRYRALAIYSFVCAVIGMMFTVDLWKDDHFQVFMYQMKNWPTRKFGETYISGGFGGIILSKLINLLNEHQRFFWSDRVMAFSALFLLSYIFNFNWLRKNFSSLFIYTTVLILALNITGSHIAERYLIFYYPFMALITALAMLNFNGKNIRYLQYVFVLLFALNFVSLVKQFRFVFRENENASLIHHELVSKLPEKDANIFAPWKFIYNEIDERNIISYQALQYYQDDLPLKMDQLTFIQLLKNKYHVKYLILDRDITRNEENDYDWFRGGVSHDNTSVKFLFKHMQYTVYQLQ